MLYPPNRVDFSANGLRFRAFPQEAEAEFSIADSPVRPGLVVDHHPV
jgi:hypothetical protein